MTFALRIEHQPSGLRLRFAQPTTTLDMSADVAQHLASLLTIEARSQVTGVVRTLELENGSRAAESDAHAHFCDCLDCLGGST